MDPLINGSRNNSDPSFSKKRHLWINEFLRLEKQKILLLEELHFFFYLSIFIVNKGQPMIRHMKTIDQPESNHGQRNTIVGFRITEDEQTKLKSIQRTMRTKGIRGTTSDALRMILHTFDIQDWSKALT